jgi:hypothetical protein
MYTGFAVQGPAASYGAQQVAGPAGQYAPLQVYGPQAYYPYQTDMTTAFSQMMPMIMMIMMFAIVMPRMKGITAPTR